MYSNIIYMEFVKIIPSIVCYQYVWGLILPHWLV